jgi:hypothetical protein
MEGEMRHRLLQLGGALAVAVSVSLVTAYAGQYDGAAVPAGERAAAARGAQNAGPTPRTPDGHPDLSGMWIGGGGGGGGNQVKPDEKGNIVQLTRARLCHQTQIDAGECHPGVNAERDAGINQRPANQPMYKPEFWEQVQHLDREGIQLDPAFHCKPNGVPRMGPPQKIVQTATELIFLYQNANTFRIIPIDGRPHDPIKSQDTTWYGDAVGKWDGTTMIIDIVGFNDESWLGWPGWLHSNNMHVVEKFTRNGNTLTWEAIVDDPDTLLEPFKMDPRTLRLNPDPKASFIEDLPCEERDTVHIVTHERG